MVGGFRCAEWGAVGGHAREGLHTQVCIICIGVVSVHMQYTVYNCVYYCDTLCLLYATRLHAQAGAGRGEPRDRAGTGQVCIMYHNNRHNYTAYTHIYSYDAYYYVHLAPARWGRWPTLDPAPAYIWWFLTQRLCSRSGFCARGGVWMCCWLRRTARGRTRAPCLPPLAGGF
jgi:hypothetical protein